MRRPFFRGEHNRTVFVALDTKKCEACWNCLGVCQARVIGRINLPWHKHVLFVNNDACTGCLRCAGICASNALSRINQKGRN